MDHEAKNETIQFTASSQPAIGYGIACILKSVGDVN